MLTRRAVVALLPAQFLGFCWEYFLVNHLNLPWRKIFNSRRRRGEQFLLFLTGRCHWVLLIIFKAEILEHDKLAGKGALVNQQRGGLVNFVNEGLFIRGQLI